MIAHQVTLTINLYLLITGTMYADQGNNSAWLEASDYFVGISPSYIPGIVSPPGDRSRKEWVLRYVSQYQCKF